MGNINEDKNWMNGITCNDRFIAFLDIDGFSDFVLKNPIKDCYNLLHTMKSEVIDNLQGLYDAKEENGIGRIQEFGSTKFINFSDSVILFTKGNTIDDLKGLLFDVAEIYTFCFRKLKKPLRGAIAYGEIYLDFENNIYTGKPIIDAYKLHENLNYYGIDIHDTAIKYINNADDKFIRLSNSFKFLKHNFTKNEKEIIGLNFVELNNPSYLPSIDKIILGDLCEEVKKIKDRYDNTIKFIETLKNANHKKTEKLSKR